MLLITIILMWNLGSRLLLIIYKNNAYLYQINRMALTCIAAQKD